MKRSCLYRIFSSGMDEKALVILRSSGVRPRGSAVSAVASSEAVECNATVAPGEVVMDECDGTRCAAFGWAIKAELAERMEHRRRAESADRSIIISCWCCL